MKKLFSAFLCLTCLALVLSSCVKGSDNQTSGDDDGQNSTPEIVEPAYTPEFFTGYEKTEKSNPRAVAVMINNTCLADSFAFSLFLCPMYCAQMIAPPAASAENA